ncbi:MAG: Cof-type HAD-IIB family hydrolase [Heliobacteriaceae bacterium]|jgi:Cof subfamily protein (haloacid dehalogenase superfamily)|nr:Cof-type HAD-IIB family hydrolase [Heliobacteriaceae bacterium]
MLNKPSTIKMIATDIDGTIMMNNFECTPAVRQCIKELSQNGVKIVLVTGRMHSATTKVAEFFGLDTPIISFNGGLIREQSGETLHQTLLDPAAARKIIDWSLENDVHLNLYMDDKLYGAEQNEAIMRYTCEREIPYNICDFRTVELKNINKLLAINFNDADKVTQWMHYLQKEFPELYIVKSMPHFCEIASPETTKYNGVEFLRNYWGLKKEEVLAIGDQNNDIELLKAGGIAVAMGNATDELKACADFVTDTVKNDGFVKAVRKFI